ncbi:MAG: Asp-tRNA(Asn)/Glu-tRNA(Gln) amidotransferase subunit GatC [Filifactor alocis]|nr:Asp-tRNA(Asn)/Glu-tRNA(Gln) amidotransferase subunit GatC [Filifactor alocis]
MINRETLDYISKLSRLEFDSDKEEEMLLSLERILNHVSSLDQCDTERCDITYNVLGMENELREDEIKPSFPREEILKNAPSKEAGCFVVPKIL